MKRLLSIGLAAMVALSLFVAPASAKTAPAGQTVDTVLFYMTNDAGEQILVSQIPVTEMDADLQSGVIDDTVYNFSLLDRYTTTVHQEAQGFTVAEFVKYAQGKSDAANIRALSLTFAGEDAVAFWEIDQAGYDNMDTYTYKELYDTPRYNFPLLYEYWDYRSQDYYDPAGVMTREQVIDHIFANGEPATMLLSVRAFSQRYMVTDSKYGTGDYNMENEWYNSGRLDTARTIRVMKPMTKDELYNKQPTAADTRYWVSNILLDMDQAPDVTPLGTVAAPTAVMTEDEDNYYIRFSCDTPGATVYFNHNYISPSYMPTCPYGGTPAVVPKSYFPNGTVTITARAVKDGYKDEGVVTLNLTSSGTEVAWENPYTDVEEDTWYYDAVEYVMTNGLFDSLTATTFGPYEPMTRAMLVTALYRLYGSPSVTYQNTFTDVSSSDPYASAVAWAFENGIVKGTSSTTYSPAQTITRQEVATMMQRYVNYVGGNVSIKGDVTVFDDADQIADWGMEGMQWAVGAKLINGMGNGLVGPRRDTTRGEMAQILLNFSNT